MTEELAEVQGLFELIADCLPGKKFQGVGFRSTGVKYANQTDLLAGHGAAYYGGRWNPPKIAAVYLSLDPITATKETYRSFSDYGFADVEVKPRVFAGARIKLHSLLDLTSAALRRKLGFTLTELVKEPWQAIQQAGQESWTQAIGRGARVRGFEGLLTPSARNRPDGINLVYFPDHLNAESHIEILAKNELPPHPSTWPK